MGGSGPLVWLLLAVSIAVPLLDHRFQLLGGVEGDHATRRNGNFLSSLRIAAGTLRFVPELEITEAGKLDALAVLERGAYFLEERFDHVLRLALVETHFLEKQVCQFGFR